MQSLGFLTSSLKKSASGESGCMIAFLLVVIRAAAIPRLAAVSFLFLSRAGLQRPEPGRYLVRGQLPGLGLFWGLGV